MTIISLKHNHGWVRSVAVIPVSETLDISPNQEIWAVFVQLHRKLLTGKGSIRQYLNQIYSEIMWCVSFQCDSVCIFGANNWNSSLPSRWSVISAYANCGLIKTEQRYRALCSGFFHSLSCSLLTFRKYAETFGNSSLQLWRRCVSR